MPVFKPAFCVWIALHCVMDKYFWNGIKWEKKTDPIILKPISQRIFI